VKSTGWSIAGIVFFAAVVALAGEVRSDRKMENESAEATIRDAKFMPMSEKYEVARSNHVCFLCGENLRQIGPAAMRYATNHNGRLPASLLDFKAEIKNPNIFVCPESNFRFSEDWSDFDESKASYRIYNSKAKLGISQRYVICKFHGGGNEILADGKVVARILP
jgi:hypothetical protein